MSTIKDIINEHVEFANSNSIVDLSFISRQLNNLARLIGNAEFMREVIDIINLILDRNNDGVFNSKDIDLLHQIFSEKDRQPLNILNFCLELFEAILIAIGKVDKPILKLDNDALQSLFMGTLIYVLYKSIDNEDEKKKVTTVIEEIYSLIIQVDRTFEISNKLVELFRGSSVFRKCFPCLKKKNNIDIEDLKLKYKLRDSYKVSIETVMLHNTISDLKLTNDELRTKLKLANEQLLELQIKIDDLLKKIDKDTGQKEDILHLSESDILSTLEEEGHLDDVFEPEVPQSIPPTE